LKVSEILIHKEIFSEDEPLSTTHAIELQKLELQDKDKEREAHAVKDKGVGDTEAGVCYAVKD